MRTKASQTNPEPARYEAPSRQRTFHLSGLGLTEWCDSYHDGARVYAVWSGAFDDYAIHHGWAEPVESFYSGRTIGWQFEDVTYRTLAELASFVSCGVSR